MGQSLLHICLNTCTLTVFIWKLEVNHVIEEGLDIGDNVCLLMSDEVIKRCVVPLTNSC